MPNFIDTEHGVATLLACIVVVTALRLVFSVGQFAWAIIKERSSLKEDTVKNLIVTLNENTRAMDRLEFRMSKVEEDLTQMPKLKLDLRRAFISIKHLAGKDWPTIRKMLMEEGMEN